MNQHSTFNLHPAEMFTAPQRARYFDLVRRAYDAVCDSNGMDAGDSKRRETWRRQQQTEAVGKPSVKHCSPVDDFDYLLVHFGQIAGDDEAVARGCTSLERRYEKKIADQLARLSRLKGETVGFDYARGILAQMKLPTDLKNVPAIYLRNVYIALRVHADRLEGKGR